MELRRAPCSFLVTALGFLSSVFPAVGQSASNQDEAHVRQLYQQITYLTQVNTITELAIASSANGVQPTAQALEAKVASQQATFYLSSFQKGAIADIRSDPWTNFVTPEFKLTQVLEIDTNLENRMEQGSANVSWFMAQAKWHQPNLTNLDLSGGLFSTTVETMMDQGSKFFLTPDVVYSRYMAYTVTASFEGQTIGPYHAMALFGKNGKGQDVISVQDQGVDSATTLEATIPHSQIYPLGLVQTRLREIPAVVAWLTEHSVSASSCSQTDASQLCCSGDSCGIADARLHKDLTAPLVVIPATH